jgi:hypothetical protein
VDVAFLAQAMVGFERMVEHLDQAEVESFGVYDPTLWTVEVSQTTAATGLELNIQVGDGEGTPQPQATVKVWLDVDDFTRAYAEQLTSDGAGKATTIIPNGALAQGSGSRWLHVTAGQDYPLAERIVPLD